MVVRRASTLTFVIVIGAFLAAGTGFLRGLLRGLQGWFVMAGLSAFLAAWTILPTCGNDDATERGDRLFGPARASQ